MKKFFNGLVIVLVIISILSYFGAGWIRENWSEHYAIKTFHFGYNDVTGDEFEEDNDVQFTFTINYYANKDNTGVEMYELKVSYFKDINLNEVYSLGVQVINPKELTYRFSEYDEKVKGPFGWIGVGDYHTYYNYELIYNDAEVTYFNSDDGLSYVSTNTLEDREEPYIIKIEDKAYAFDFEKEALMSTFHGITTGYNYFTSSFAYFFYKVYVSSTNITKGTGKYENLTLEINDVFNFYEYNSLTGKFDIQKTDWGYDISYMGIKVNYYTRGAKMHEDSLYGQIGRETAGGVIWKNS